MRSWAMLAAGGVGMLMVALAMAGSPAHAQALPPLNEWEPEGVSIEAAGGGVVLTLEESSGTFGTAHAPVTAGAAYSVSVALGAWSDADVYVSLRFVTAQGESVIRGAISESPTAHAASAPAAEYVRIVISVEGGSGKRAEILSVSFSEQAGNPTATPTATPTPEPTATSAPSNQPGGSSTPRTATPTRTPTPPKASTPTRVPTLPRVGTPAPTATLGPTSTPTRVPGAGFGGLLANGDFEAIADGRPTYWLNFGGEMSATGEEYRGHYAACLASSSASVKWLYQLVTVEEGSWYEASAFGRANGGEAFLRVSWYESASGNGQTMWQDDSLAVASTDSWLRLSTGPILAPDGARSARVRLTISGGGMTGCFDDAQFVEVAAPAPTPIPTAGSTSTGTAAAATPTRTATPAGTGGGQIAPLPLLPAVGQEAGPETLAISEVMSDPPEPGRDGPWEWVEIHNFGDEPIDLARWRIEDGSQGDMLPSLTVPAGAYVVIAGASALFEPGVAVARVSDGEIGNGLANGGDVVRLVSPGGRVVDALSYGENASVFAAPPPAASTGETLGVIAGGPLPRTAEDWLLTLRPTPGEANIFGEPEAVAGVVTGGPATTPSPEPEAPTPDVQPRVQVEDDDNGGGGYGPWIVLGGLAGISVGVGYAALWPRIKRWMERRRAR